VIKSEQKWVLHALDSFLRDLIKFFFLNLDLISGIKYINLLINNSLVKVGSYSDSWRSI